MEKELNKSYAVSLYNFFKKVKSLDNKKEYNIDELMISHRISQKTAKELYDLLHN